MIIPFVSDRPDTGVQELYAPHPSLCSDVVRNDPAARCITAVYRASDRLPVSENLTLLCADACVSHY